MGESSLIDFSMIVWSEGNAFLGVEATKTGLRFEPMDKSKVDRSKSDVDRSVVLSTGAFVLSTRATLLAIAATGAASRNALAEKAMCLSAKLSSCRHCFCR